MLPHLAAAVVAGALLPLQALTNARLAGHLAGPLWAALANFGVGFVALSLFLLVSRFPVPGQAQLSGVPPLLFVGGIMGAFFVAVSAFAVPKLGAAGMTTAIVASQLIASIALDHYGVMQNAQPITAPRLAGVFLLLTGAYLILRPAN